MAQLTYTFKIDEDKMREICDEAVKRLIDCGYLWVDKDLIKKLDELEFIKNINYYTNNCSAHDELERLIGGLNNG